MRLATGDHRPHAETFSMAVGRSTWLYRSPVYPLADAPIAPPYHQSGGLKTRDWKTQDWKTREHNLYGQRDVT